MSASPLVCRGVHHPAPQTVEYRILASLYYLIYLLSTAWFTCAEDGRTRPEEQREIFFALLLAGLNLLGTLAALVAAIRLENPWWLSRSGNYLSIVA